jgi:YHS domain-containing protein
MTDTSDLQSRISAEFTATEARIKQFQTEETQAYHGRQQRLEQYEKIREQLRAIWKPRLEVLAKQFSDKVDVKVGVIPTGREATFQFRSPLADIALKFSVSTDYDVHNVVLDYDLHILPILLKFEPHHRAEFPLDAIDTAAIAQWVDDRIVEFVQTYLSLHQNEYYLKSHMVTDPISNTRFPKYAAAATTDWRGSTYYFISVDTQREFAVKNQIGS